MPVRLFLLASFTLTALAAQANAGMSMNFSGQPMSNGSHTFNFAVSSTNPSTMGSMTDSPTEPVLHSFFPQLLQIREFNIFGVFTPFRAPGMVSGGSGGGGGARGGSFAAFGNITFRKPMGGGGNAGGLPNGSNTTSGDQPINGTCICVCIPDDDQSGGPGDQGDGSDDNGGGQDGGGGSPNPSAVPEPGAMALWSVVTGMLVFGTRRLARR